MEGCGGDAVEDLHLRMVERCGHRCGSTTNTQLSRVGQERSWQREKVGSTSSFPLCPLPKGMQCISCGSVCLCLFVLLLAMSGSAWWRPSIDGRCGHVASPRFPFCKELFLSLFYHAQGFGFGVGVEEKVSSPQSFPWGLARWHSSQCPHHHWDAAVSHQSDVFVLLQMAWPFCWRALPQKSPNGQRCGALLYGISVKPLCNKCHWKELCVVLCRGNRSARGITGQESNL